MRNFDAKNLFTVDMRVGMVYTVSTFPSNIFMVAIFSGELGINQQVQLTVLIQESISHLVMAGVSPFPM